MRLPERGEHPAAGDPDKAAGDNVAHEVIIGADKPDGNGKDRKRVKQSPPRIIDPQNRDHRASDRGVARRERRVGVAAAEEIKAIDSVVQK